MKSTQFCVVLAKDRAQMQPDGVIHQLVGVFTNKTVLELSQRSQSRMLGKGVDPQMEGDGRHMARHESAPILLLSGCCGTPGSTWKDSDDWGGNVGHMIVVTYSKIVQGKKSQINCSLLEIC